MRKTAPRAYNNNKMYIIISRTACEEWAAAAANTTHVGMTARPTTPDHLVFIRAQRTYRGSYTFRIYTLLYVSVTAE